MRKVNIKMINVKNKGKENVSQTKIIKMTKESYNDMIRKNKYKEEKMKGQISDSIPCGIILALSGGCMDAYSYIFRGHVFANAQTGNILLFGVSFANREYSTALKYLWPVIAFMTGIIISDLVSNNKVLSKIHWRQIAVIIEIIALTIVSFLNNQYDSIVNTMISFACGIQVESFRKIHGNAIATTMCIGNLRSGTNNMNQFFITHNMKYLKKAFLYFGIIISFVIGAIIESILIKNVGQYAILFSSFLLAIALLIMFIGED